MSSIRVGSFILAAMFPHPGMLHSGPPAADSSLKETTLPAIPPFERCEASLANCGEFEPFLFGDVVEIRNAVIHRALASGRLGSEFLITRIVAKSEQSSPVEVGTLSSICEEVVRSALERDRPFGEQLIEELYFGLIKVGGSKASSLSEVLLVTVAKSYSESLGAKPSEHLERVVEDILSNNRYELFSALQLVFPAFGPKAMAYYLHPNFFPILVGNVDYLPGVSNDQVIAYAAKLEPETRLELYERMIVKTLATPEEDSFFSWHRRSFVATLIESMANDCGQRGQVVALGFAAGLDQDTLECLTSYVDENLGNRSYSDNIFLFELVVQLNRSTRPRNRLSGLKLSRALSEAERKQFAFGALGDPESAVRTAGLSNAAEFYLDQPKKMIEFLFKFGLSDSDEEVRSKALYLAETLLPPEFLEKFATRMFDKERNVSGHSDYYRLERRVQGVLECLRMGAEADAEQPWCRRGLPDDF